MNFSLRLKKNLTSHFGESLDFLESLLETLPSTVPHTTISEWSLREDIQKTGVCLSNKPGNRILQIIFAYSLPNGGNFVLEAQMHKGRAFSVHERAFVNSIVREIGNVIVVIAKRQLDYFLIGQHEVTDGAVADFLRKITGSKGVDFIGIIRFFKEMGEQSYEANPITYGVVILPHTESKKNIAIFPKDVVKQKRFQSLTDGYNSALLLDNEGKIVRLISLECTSSVGEHFRPLWLGPLANAALCVKGLGIALMRNGALMIAWQGNLLLSFRNGKWILWSHNENIELIHEGIAPRKNVSREIRPLAAKLYQCALEISFRETGGLFEVLRSPRYLKRIVHKPEQMNGERRTKGDLALSEWLSQNILTEIENEIIINLAALDGAVVLGRNGAFLSYGSVLLVPRQGGLSKIEGSRSRAAHSASFFGLSIKISSDGGIDVLESGKTLLAL